MNSPTSQGTIPPATDTRPVPPDAETCEILARAAQADPPLGARTWRVLAAVLTGITLDDEHDQQDADDLRRRYGLLEARQ